MPLVMYDSVTVASDPSGADAYAGYVDGYYANFAALKARFPHAHLLDIAVLASDDATCLDVEPGDATIAQIYGWFKRQVKRGVWRPVIYTSATSVDKMVATMTANGFKRAGYRIWSAHYGAGKHFCGPATCGLTRHDVDGTQWRSTADWDESTLRDAFFGSAPPPPPPEEEDEVAMLKDGAHAVTIISLGRGTKGWIAFGSDNTLTNQPNPVVRVAVHSHKKGWSQVQRLTVHSGDKPSVHFKERDVDVISVQRVNGDDGDNVAVGFNLG